MIGWIILAVLVGLIVLVMLVPIGADIRYEDEVIRISAKAAGIKLQLIPKPKREQKAEKHKKEKPKKLWNQKLNITTEFFHMNA